MAGVHGEANCRAMARSILQRAKRGRISMRVRIRSRVQLDGQRAERARFVDRVQVWPDEKARPKAGRIEPGNSLGDAAVVAGDIEAALGRDFFTALGDEGHLMRP